VVVLWFIFGVLVSIFLLLVDWLWGNRIAGFVLWRRVSRIRVSDNNDNPVHRARVVVQGLGCHWTNKRGYTKVYIPRTDLYAIQVDYPEGPSRKSTNIMEPHRNYEQSYDRGFYLSSLDTN